MKRQLQIPGTLRRPPTPPARARRDLSASAFSSALARHDFRPEVGGMHFVDMWTGKQFAAECRRDPIRISRRATLAKLIRSRGEI